MAALSHKFSLLLARYQEYLHHRNYAKRTAAEYPKGIKYFLSYLQQQDIHDIKEPTLKDLQIYQMEWDGLNASTRRYKLATLKNFFSFLHRTEKIYLNPAQSLEAPRLPKRLPKNILEEREVRKLLKQPNLTTFKGVRDRAMLELMYSSGLRNSEVRCLNLDDIEMEERKLRVIGKGDKEAYVPFGKEAHKALNHYLKFWRYNYKGRDLFISTKHQRALSGRAVAQMVNGYTKKAGLKKQCTPHSLRHSCATHLLKHGADIRHIQELLRHSDLSSTQVYTRVDITDLKEAQKKFHPREQSYE